MHSKSVLRRENDSIFEQIIRQTQFEQDHRLRLKIETGLFILLLGIIFSVRIQDITNNTLFIDEAISVTVGEEFLVGNLPDNTTTWMLGSFLYPVITTLTSKFAGVAGLRLLSLVLSIVSIILIFLITQRLFDRQSALWAILIFGLAGNAISLSQIAINDAMAIPLFVIAFYFYVTALLGKSDQENVRILLAAISFATSILTKYIVLFYLPTFVLLGFILCRYFGRSTYRIVTQFLCPIIFILGAYLAHSILNLVSLIAVYDQFFTEVLNHQNVIRILLSEIGFVILIILTLTCTHREPLCQILFDKPRLQKSENKFASASLKWLFGFSMLAGPLIHLTIGDGATSLTYNLYSLVFLAPLAGRGITIFIRYGRAGHHQQHLYIRLAGAAISILGLVWFVEGALDRSWGIQHSWPNVSGVVTYLKSQGVTQDSIVLAEGAQIYEYYFGIGATDEHRWNNTWYMEYGELQDIEAMQAAILDDQFDFVVLDNYHNPTVNQILEETLFAANYILDYEETQSLSIGSDINLQVYVSPRGFKGGN